MPERGFCRLPVPSDRTRFGMLRKPDLSIAIDHTPSGKLLFYRVSCFTRPRRTELHTLAGERDIREHRRSCGSLRLVEPLRLLNENRRRRNKTSGRDRSSAQILYADAPILAGQDPMLDCQPVASQ